MDQLRRRFAAVALATVVSISACSGGGGDDAASTTSVPESITTTTRTMDTGGIDIPDIPGTFKAPIPSLGFGIAIPQGWEATILTDDALAKLEDATLARPAFLDSARQVASTGAVFYAAGVDDQGRVAELKVDVQDNADTSPAAVQELAGSVVKSGQVTDGVVVDDDPNDDRIRVDYRLALPAADGGAPIDALGSQIFVVDGDRLWSFIITSEDTDTQTALLQVFDASITFD